MECSMHWTGLLTRAGALGIAVLALTHDAHAQSSGLQGAWAEEGITCASVFKSGSKAIAFKRPASPFSQAFIISGKRLTTPLATCQIVGVTPSGDKEIINLRCTTSITTDTARTVVALIPGGGLYRYSSDESGLTTKYQRCGAGDLRSMAPEAWPHRLPG
jgi:hypothetical protein